MSLQHVKFVFTCHGTVLYVADDGELRHGRPSPCRSKNFRLAREGSEVARLIHVGYGADYTIACSSSGCWSITNATKIDLGEGSEVLNVVSADGNGFVLVWQNHYLSALPDGSVKLTTASHLRSWETFNEETTELRDQPRVACMTMVFNEPVFLPIWESYYARQFGHENLFLVDHGTDDDSTHHSKIPNRINLPRDRFDEHQRRTFISGLQATLLNYYDAVLFTDVDEFVVADPECFSGLLHYCRQRLDRFVTTVGLDVLHFPEIERDLDLSRPILEQRRYVRFSAQYCKPLLAEIPLVWTPGFHRCQYPARPDPRLFLFHLKLMDRGLALRQLAKSRQIPWSANSVRLRHGFQHRYGDEEFLSRLYPPLPETRVGDLIDAFAFEDELRKFDASNSHLFRGYLGEPKILADRFRGIIPGIAPRDETRGAQ